MLIDAAGSTAVSSIGWIDAGGLWVFRPASGAPPATVRLSDAKHLSLHAGDGGFFVVVHHSEGDWIAVTVHNLSQPEDVIAQALVNADGTRFTGDTSAWSRVPEYYTTYYNAPALQNYALVQVLPRESRVDLQPFSWFTNDAYDKAYQGIVGVTPIPDDTGVLVSVQRSSRVIVHDPALRRQTGAFDLAGQAGNPTLIFRRRANELWADDYDTIVALEPGTWRTLRTQRLQGPSGHTSHFIGQFAFDADETMCTVARPYSRDVIAIDPGSMRTTLRCALEGQPLKAAALPDRTVVARDWKTGRLLRGELR